METPNKQMSRSMRVVFWFVVANAYAGALTLILRPSDTKSGFFWEITPPINARMFGIFFLIAGSLVLQAVLVGRWEPARYLAVMIPVFGSMMLVTSLLHLERFDEGFGKYYWLTAYSVAPIAAVLFYLQHERGGANWEVVDEPVSRSTRALAVLGGVATEIFVVVGYLFPEVLVKRWPWTISPLMVRVFLSWLSGVAVSFLWFSVERDWSRLRPVAPLLVASSALILVVLLLHGDELKGSAWPFAGAVLAIGVVGASIEARHFRRLPAVGGRSPAR